MRAPVRCARGPRAETRSTASATARQVRRARRPRAPRVLWLAQRCGGVERGGDGGLVGELHEHRLILEQPARDRRVLRDDGQADGDRLHAGDRAPLLLGEVEEHVRTAKQVRDVLAVADESPVAPGSSRAASWSVSSRAGRRPPAQEMRRAASPRRGPPTRRSSSRSARSPSTRRAARAESESLPRARAGAKLSTSTPFAINAHGQRARLRASYTG